MSKKEKIVLAILCCVIAFMDVSGLPCIMLKIKVQDVDPFIIPLIINFLLIGVVAFAVLKIFNVSYKFGFCLKGLKNGIKQYTLPCIIAGALSFVAFFVGLQPFDYKPTIYKLLIEGVFYYIGVAIIEEFYVRGILLNVIEAFACKKQKCTSFAIVLSSLIFALGHVPGVLKMGFGIVLFKLIMTLGMGLYFGAIYKKTNNLFLPIIMHALIDICVLPYCFTLQMRYETISIIILTITYFLLGLYACYLMKKNNTSPSLC